MTDIQKGDWVTISCQGPYEVMGGAGAGRLLVKIGDELHNRVLSEWCTKVPPPAPPKWEPEPRTLWQDRDGDLWVVNDKKQMICVTYSVSNATTPESAWEWYGPFHPVDNEGEEGE